MLNQINKQNQEMLMPVPPASLLLDLFINLFEKGLFFFFSAKLLLQGLRFIS